MLIKCLGLDRMARLEKAKKRQAKIHKFISSTKKRNSESIQALIEECKRLTQMKIKMLIDKEEMKKKCL